MAEPDMVVIFDGVCGLCDRSVRFILEHDRRGRVHFVAGQTATGAELLARFGVDGGETMVAVRDDRALVRSDAALAIAGCLDVPWNLAALFGVVPRPIRDAVYRWVSRNRYKWFGRLDQCAMPEEGWMDRFRD